MSGRKRWIIVPYILVNKIRSYLEANDLVIRKEGESDNVGMNFTVKQATTYSVVFNQPFSQNCFTPGMQSVCIPTTAINYLVEEKSSSNWHPEGQCQKPVADLVCYAVALVCSACLNPSSSATPALWWQILMVSPWHRPVVLNHFSSWTVNRMPPIQL